MLQVRTETTVPTSRAIADRSEKKPTTRTKTDQAAEERVSFGQSRFWFLDQAIKDRTTFNIAILVRLEGRLRVKDVGRAVEQVAQRHEALRTRYFARGEYGEQAMQAIDASATVPFSWRQIQDESEARQELDELRNHVWDLSASESMRVSLLSLKGDKVHFLILGCHHINMDGISFQIFYSDLEKAYKGQRLSTLPPPLQYRGFAKRQREAWETGKMDADLDYFRGIVPKDPKPLPLLPFAKVTSRVPLEKYSTHRVDLRIDADLTAKCKATARRLKSTTFHFYLAVFQILIQRLVGDDCKEVFVGVADANRTDAKFMGTLGFFLNLLPLRFARDDATNFAEAVQQARDKVYGALAHSQLPFDILLEKLEIPRSSAHTPLFQIFVDYRQGVQERQKYMGLKAVGEDWHLAKTGYDVSLDIIENAAGDARIEIRLQEALYSEASARLLLQAYVHLLAQVAENPDVDWKTPEIWPAEVIERSLSEGRGKTIDYTWAPTVAHRIDEFIAKQPSAPALKDGTNSLTYAQMDDRINAICAALVSAGVKTGDRVGVFQKPTTDWICSLLAIFRAGAVYMPLDTRTPVQRLAAMVSDARPAAILAHDETWTDVPAVAPHSANINITHISPAPAPLPNLATPSSPAALLFTSGSTGTPKGSLNTHANIIHQLEGYSTHSALAPDVGLVLQQSAYSFDKSLEQIFAALAHGGALFVVPAHQRGDPLSITRIMADEGVTFTATTPSEYLMWLRYARENLRRCVGWRRAVLGGEVVPASLIKGFRELGLPVRLTNSYGPAEITMACAKGDLAYEEIGPGEMPVMAGTVLPGYTAYVVDQELKPVPVGCPGEIVVSGAGVSMGYLNNEDLTSQKYLPCPWQPGKMYRTGDKGRLGGDGVLYCDGRLEGDSQIKLRGVRMELEDIESCITQTAAGAVTSVVVSKRGDAEQDSEFLAAHVVLAPGVNESILDRLRTTLPLPQYMIPAVMVPVKDLPMTAHFKISRKEAMALPVPEIKKTEVDTGALTPTEAQLAGLWSELIPGLRNVDASSPFFLVGGNSLMLVKLQAMIRMQLHANLRLIDLMENDTLGKMARVVEEAAGGAAVIDWEKETALPELPPSVGTVPSKDKDLVVMLTGVTGVLGRNMLAKLAADERVAKIYAVAVRAPIEGRVTTTSEKVTILTGDLAQPLLGLEDADFKTLSEVDVIFHAGANRSFWDSYYELRATNVYSVKELVRIAAPRKIPIHFMSSGEVITYGSETPPVDGSDGYVSSKWAAEKILQKAAAQVGIEVVVHRPMKSDEAGAAPVEALEELMVLARQMGKRPALDGLSGTLAIVPLSQIVDALAEGLFERSSGVKHLSHGSSFNVDIAEFAAAVMKDDEIMKLEGMSALKWTGVAKKMGWSKFMLAQEIFMEKEGGRVVSKR
ncbi:Polyketide synthase-nonribosomal peptide synthetase [Lasiodiplodia hormozganensis]|uniref:Polyketide synthase-nonribosomal peptide synthetase n=1 Tax=Lasiodiplodia hormozganensis TaxID=869390 RepID=A0AA39Y545_9PEZI|nr:Polyketide synthase-nonribosomal peptide synthetase [Lasiodiplodia hormozganensis]